MKAHRKDPSHLTESYFISWEFLSLFSAITIVTVWRQPPCLSVI